MSRVRPLAMLATVVVVAGCGGGGDRLSQEELVSEADAICTRFEERLDEVEEPQDVQDVERFADETRPIIEEGIDELRALEPPEELEGEYDEWIAMNEDALQVIDDLSEAAAAGDEARVQEVIEDAERREQEADNLAREIGLEECAND
jgi:hypothetical protein